MADDDGGANTYSATVTVSAAPPTEQPTPALCYAEGAQSWQDFAQGRQKNGKPVQASRSNPALALGLPQRNDTVNFVSLGFGGSLTLRFANPIVNDGTGKADIRVWETSFGDARRSWSRYPEAVKLYASADGVNWTLLGQTTDKDQAYDLVLPQAQYLKLVDVSNWAKFGPIGDGFDLDAVEVLSGCIRP
ncbi:hypothetical protein [Candidatus Chloroploca sp. Khr17]|uniref:hypothetical protein n=1 Tax=Candidatus Chloroploca sp. Khr17 TaxID=2496869 RepID=UPI00101BB43A|nr:hypothetical protein [Candidatus Chloroploca sp. Khr17]